MPPPPGGGAGPHGGALSGKPAPSLVPSIPPHSLVSFGLFLRLPGYAEVLLKERKKAQCLLRLVLGVTDDGEGGENSGVGWCGSHTGGWTCASGPEIAC